jgi:hypothetical protein
MFPIEFPDVSVTEIEHNYTAVCKFLLTGVWESTPGPLCYFTHLYQLLSL